MKGRFLIFAFCSLILIMSSCRSYKELVPFRDAEPGSNIPVLSESETEYRIIPGDILYISIKTLNEDVNRLFNPETRLGAQTSYQTSQEFASPAGAYLNGYEVDTAGMLNLPFMGKMKVAGHTQIEIEGIVQQKADEFLKDAIVKVKLLNYKFIILGEVESPGVYTYFGNRLTIPEALAMAGGHSDISNIKKVMVIRPTAEGNQNYMLDLSSTMAYTSEAFYLKPDDYVYVYPHKFKTIQISAPAYTFFFGTLGWILALIAIIPK